MARCTTIWWVSCILASWLLTKFDCRNWVSTSMRGMALQMGWLATMGIGIAIGVSFAPAIFGDSLLLLLLARWLYIEMTQ